MTIGAGGKASGGSTSLPVLALLTAQLFTSSWHVLGKHVMQQVPYLAPISYVLIRTLASSLFLLLVGALREGRAPFPRLYREGPPASSGESGFSVQAGPSPSLSSISSVERESCVGLHLSQCSSANSLDNVYNGTMKGDHPQSPKKHRRHHHHHHHHRTRRRKRGRRTLKQNIVMGLHSIISSIRIMLHNVMLTIKFYQKQRKDLNPETVQIIFAGLSGMLLLPTCYTTGLILTSPTVASVWDGPMVPLGCFCAAVTLGLEKRSERHPFGQVGSLLLTVGGSVVVLLVDYLGGGHGMPEGSGHHAVAIQKSEDGNANDHVQFLRGNLVLMGVVAAYSATALLQKRLNHHPPIQLTAWMFGIAHAGCLALLLLDSILGGRVTGCSLGQALRQLRAALTMSPTFRCGLLYSAVFVSGACFSILSYASSHLESSVITLFAATQPPITAVLEWIWEGKELGWEKIGGMVCVGLGMCFFTHVKRIEHEMNGNHVKERHYLHLEKSHSCNGSNGRAS